MPLLDRLDYGKTELDEALIELHTRYPKIMRLIYSEIEEKGYAFVKKSQLFQVSGGNKGYYVQLIKLLRKVFKVESTRSSRYIIVFPRRV